RRVRHAPLQALLHVVLGLFERVPDELERRRVVEVADREDRLEHRLEAGALALLGLDARLQEALEGVLLNLDEIGNLEDPRDLREILAETRCVLGELDLGHAWVCSRVRGVPVVRARAGGRAGKARAAT